MCVLIDSGASDSALLSGECKYIPTGEAVKSQNGHAIRAAGRHRIANEGQTGITFACQERTLRALNCYVADMRKTVGSVSEFADAGRNVVLSNKEVYIEDEQAERIKLRQSNGMWYMHCWRVPHAIATDPNKLAARFERQGR